MDVEDYGLAEARVVFTWQEVKSLAHTAFMLDPDLRSSIEKLADDMADTTQQHISYPEDRFALVSDLYRAQEYEQYRAGEIIFPSVRYGVLSRLALRMSKRN